MIETFTARAAERPREICLFKRRDVIPSRLQNPGLDAAADVAGNILENTIGHGRQVYGSTRRGPAAAGIRLVVREAVIRRPIRMPHEVQLRARIVVTRCDVDAFQMAASLPRNEVVADFRTAALQVPADV